MSENTIKVEQLAGGLRAVFVNLPHFRTHSARLLVCGGSAHETPETYGSAHFLEHVTFQGTAALPNKKAVHRYAEAHGLARNAGTSMTTTTYWADGYDLQSVGFFVSELALRPRLAPKMLEGERNPIVDELRGYASSPYFYLNIEHDKAVRGPLYARPIGGTIEDVQHMTPKTLKNFHRRHYRLDNAILVICSADPVEQQRKFAASLVADYPSAGAPNPQPIELGPFNPSNLNASLQRVDLPTTAQSSVTICYDLPKTANYQEQLVQHIIGLILSRTAHNHLRREMALCYDAWANASRVVDLGFGSDKNWARLKIGAELDGKDSIAGLDALYNDVLHRPLPSAVFESILVGLRRDVDHLMQSPPAAVADRLCSMLCLSQRSEVALDEVVRFAQTVSLTTLRKLHRQIVATKPLILATSPDQAVLDKVGAWADSKA